MSLSSLFCQSCSETLRIRIILRSEDMRSKVEELLEVATVGDRDDTTDQNFIITCMASEHLNIKKGSKDFSKISRNSKLVISSCHSGSIVVMRSDRYSTFGKGLWRKERGSSSKIVQKMRNLHHQFQADSHKEEVSS